MNKPCDTCAGFTNRGIAFKEVILTCSKCRIAREHIYCMRVNPSLVEDWDPNNWVCESCEQRSRMLSPNSSIKEDKLEPSADRGRYDGMVATSPSRSCYGTGWQGHSKKQKPVVNGKVKFITDEEVRRLSFVDPPQKSPAGYITVTQQSPDSGLKANPSIIRSEIAIPHRRGRPQKMESISKINQRACQNLKHSRADVFIPATKAEPSKETAMRKKSSTVATFRNLSPIHSPEKRAPGTPTKGHTIKEQPIDASLLSQGVETYSRMAVEELTKFSCSPSTSRHSLSNMSYGGNTSATEHNNSDCRQRDLQNLFPRVHSYCSYFPALHATWKGGFIILDPEIPAQFIGGFQAQPPCTVHQKAYEFSRKMPPVLRATLFPRLLLWADPFLEECPDLQDVGLYFFPDDNIAGSKETYALLFEVMDTQDSVMRVYFDGMDPVDLLIFTSKQLNSDSLNIPTSPSTENFLWGIFRDENHCRADMDDNGVTVDMEVDMTGGNLVGTVDVVVPKNSSFPCIRPEPIMKAVQQLLTIKKEEHSSYQTRLRVLDSTIKKLLALNSEEPIKQDGPSASTEVKTTGCMKVKLEKDEDETCLETDKKTLPSQPCFPAPSPQSGAAGSTDEILGTTSAVDEIGLLRMLCNKDNYTRI